MQHIINVAFDFDDKKISESIESQVEQKVVDNITEEVKGIIYGKRWIGAHYDNKDTEPLRKMVGRRIDEMLEENKELIVATASKILCEKLFRSKLVKDSVKENISQPGLASCE